MFKFLLGLLVISALVVIGMNAGNLIRSQTTTPSTYKLGDYVQVKLTGDMGMVTERLWSETYVVTLKNYDTKIFHDFELTPASAGGMIGQSSGGTSPAAEKTPNDIFSDEKVWNPQTQRYETRAN